MAHTRKINVKMLVLCSMFTALIAVGAFIRIPISYMDYFTLQTFFVILAGLLLGPKYGAISCAIYVAIGLIGIPIFAGGGGIDYVLRPSFGYLVGFIIAAFVMGLIIKKLNGRKYWQCLLASFIGILIIYAIGLTYKYFILNFYVGTKTGMWAIILMALPLDIPSDIATCFVTALVANRLSKIKSLNLY